MSSKKVTIAKIVVILMLFTTAWVYGKNKGVTLAKFSNSSNPNRVESSGSTKEENSERDKVTANKQENEITEYFEKTKDEILQGRKFNNQSTAVDALLTLISAYHHQDQNTLEQIFPIVKMKQFQGLSSPETRAQMLAVARQSIFCRIEIENRPPKESDICAIYTRESPEKPIDQVWSFAYVEGAWRFAGSTSATDNWRTQAQQAEALTRNTLQSEATKVEAATAENESESQTEQAPEKNGRNSKRLVAWWKLDNDANDSAGANHGSIHGDPVFEAGKLGQAIRLDGDDYVDCGNADVLNFGTGDWTLSAWIKTTQTGTNESAEQMNRGTIFAKGGDEVDGIRIALILNDSQLGMMTLTTDDNINNKVQTTSGTRVNDGAWHHIVGMRNANQLHLYIDGQLHGRSLLYDDYDLSGVSQHNAYIGAITDHRDNSLYKRFVGLIDEVCVFACALDADSISALYSGKNPMIVAEQARAITATQPQSWQTTPPASDVDITGRWKGTFVTLGRSCIIKFEKKTDDTLAAILTADETTIPFSKVIFSKGRLRLEAAAIQIVIEGMIAEDGKTIDCQWQQPGQQILSLVLKRIEQVLPDVSSPSVGEATSGLPDQPRSTHSGGASRMVTTLILVFILVGVIGGIVLFVMKSSIRR